MKTLIAFSMLVVACSTQSAVVPSAKLVASKNFSFVPKYPWAPTMRLDITYMNQKIMFTHCCRNYSYYPRYDKIQPENPFVRLPVEKRHQPIDVTFAYQNQTRPDALKNYTLLMVDPDVPFATAGTRDKPLLHWLVHNLNLFYPSGNTTIFSYKGPAPPDQKPHNYVFLLYEQGRSATPMNIYTVTYNATSRTLFDVNRFVRTFNLTLVGVSWFEAANDPYTNYTKVLRNPTTAAMYCPQATGWSPDGCERYTMGANMLGMTLALFFVPIVVMVKFVV